MYYSSFAILAVVLHVIINHDALKKTTEVGPQGIHSRYRQFLIALLIFYVADLGWGFSVDSGIRVIAYIDTLFFFGGMALSVLLWTRFVVSFLGMEGKRSLVFLSAGWFVFGFLVLHLIINFFRPIIFTFTSECEYIPGDARHGLLITQILMFALVSVYTLYVAARSEESRRGHYLTVGLSGGVMALFIILQATNPFAPFYTIGCLLANCMVHVFVEEDERREMYIAREKTQREKERYSQISTVLAKEYDAIYYINIETGKYFEVSSGEKYKEKEIPTEGPDYFREADENILRYVHPDDRDFARTMCCRETVRQTLEKRKSYSYKYRVMVGDEARMFLFQALLSEDGEHYVLSIKDIQDNIIAEAEYREKQKNSITFSMIAESLASNYDAIYYVDLENGDYTSYTSKNIFGELTIQESGTDFFRDARKNAALLIHPQDRDKMFMVLDKDYILSALEHRKQFDFQYRLIVDDRAQHTRMSVRKSSDGKHMIIGVENIEAEIRKEKEQQKALKTEKELARRDELTGLRNKTSFAELEVSVQESIEKGTYDSEFALVVCDLNNLKVINDTKGHKAGDEYIAASAKILCDVFDHSPVYRVGGDEFAIFLSGRDFAARSALLEKIKKISVENRDRKEGPVIAVGMAEFDPAGNASFNSVFEKADGLMYENKKELKSQ